MILPTILSILLLPLFVAFIIGLINPAKILRWSKKPTRLKIIGFFLLFFFAIIILIGVTLDEEIMAEDSIENAEKHIENKDYEKAKRELAGISSDNIHYSKAKYLIELSDSLIKKIESEWQIELEHKKQEEEKRKQDSLALENKIKEENEQKKKEQEFINQKEQLQKEITAIKKGVDFTIYKKTPDGLQNEITLFALWGKLIQEGLQSENKDIIILAKQLKSKVVNIQLREFPALRKQNAKLLNNTLWEDDISVRAFGKGYRYMYFTGGVFAANRNIKEFQGQISDMLYLFRYKQTRYEWYKDADDYTYYDLQSEKDSKLVIY